MTVRSEPDSRLHGPSLGVALLVMLAATVYPPMLAGPDGRAEHALAGLLFLAMSAGLVRGVGFIPRRRPWRWLFSGWTCAAALALAGALWLAR